MKWKKIGRIFCANKHNNWLYSHAMIPIAERVDNYEYRIYFSPRDRSNRGHGAFLHIDLRKPLEVKHIFDRPVLEPGDLGCFDDSGALPNAIVNANGQKLLYYTGINIGVTVKIRNSIGLAKWNEVTNSFEKCYQGPVIDRTKEYPHFVATPEVHYEAGKFRAWFSCCVGWKKENGEPKHYYRIEYAESQDGINWLRDGTVAIDFKDEYEYAIGVPRVVKDDDEYKMWFCSRASGDYPTYRIRYALSTDGIKWDRQDHLVGIDISPSGWDSEMICYPYVFDHDDDRYMLYNGNGYGKTGFGLAILEED